MSSYSAINQSLWATLTMDTQTARGMACLTNLTGWQLPRATAQIGDHVARLLSTNRNVLDLVNRNLKDFVHSFVQIFRNWCTVESRFRFLDYLSVWLLVVG